MNATYKFNVGDRVIGIGRCDGVDLTGRVGTVRRAGNCRVGVEFDEKGPFHTLAGLCENGHGWSCSANSIELYDISDEWAEACGNISMEALL